jgi:hypothetical protein
MYLNFGEWAPDLADIGTDTLDTAQNVFPGPNAWGPAKSLVTTAAALPAPCRGLSDAPQESGSFATYAGTTTKLYRFDAATQAWGDVSRLVGGAYAVPTNGYWSFAKFGPLLIATNGSDPVQFIDVNSGTNFAALPGSPPLAQYVTVVEDRVMLAGLALFPTSIAWSDINDSGVWMPGLGLADQQQFSSGGNTQAVCSAAAASTWVCRPQASMRALTPIIHS